MPVFEHFSVDDDFAEEMERRIDEMLIEQDAGLDGDVEDIPSTPSGQPYCGGPCCVVREVMVLTSQLVLEGARAGLVELLDVPPAPALNQ